MSIYQTTQGYGVDYRDEFGRRHRRFVGTLEAVQAVEEQLVTTAAHSRGALNICRMRSWPMVCG